MQKSEVKFVLRNASMKDEHARFSGSILAAYDRYLGPVLFQRYAEDLTRCKACG